MTARKKRVAVPTSTSDRVLFASDRACCICHQTGKAGHIHHLNEDPSDNHFDNLALLCLEHHEEASRRSNIARRLSAGVIRQYRDDWYAEVSARRAVALPKVASATVDQHNGFLEALACHEVRKAAHNSEWIDWPAMKALLNQIAPYASAWNAGDRTRAEVLSVVHTISSKTRHRMPADVASLCASVTFSALPIISLVGPDDRTVSKDRLGLFKSASGVGWSLSYDGIKYLRSEAVVRAGAEVLWAVLRCAALNRVQTLRAETNTHFSRLIALAEEYQQPAAKAILAFERDDAVDLEGL